MAKKFLDLDGLKILWTKIVNKIQTDIANKANISGTLQKDDIIIALDQRTIVNSGVQLSKLATKAELSAIPKFAIQVVTSLPTSNISATTVYLLSSGSENNNLYTEYIYVNSKWEKLGEQKVDLTSYVKYTGSIHDDAIIVGSSEGTVKEHASLSGTSISNHLTNKSNPHGVTKAQVGLGSVENKACDTSVTSGSDNYITSGAVYAHVSNNLASYLKNTGTQTISNNGSLYLKVSSEGDRTEGVIFDADGSIVIKEPDGSSEVYYLPGMSSSGMANYELALKYDLPTAISDADINALS